VNDEAGGKAKGVALAVIPRRRRQDNMLVPVGGGWTAKQRPSRYRAAWVWHSVSFRRLGEVWEFLALSGTTGLKGAADRVEPSTAVRAVASGRRRARGKHGVAVLRSCGSHRGCVVRVWPQWCVTGAISPSRRGSAHGAQGYVVSGGCRDTGRAARWPDKGERHAGRARAGRR
jgi:hypothetical protein